MATKDATAGQTTGTTDTGRGHSHTYGTEIPDRERFATLRDRLLETVETAIDAVVEHPVRTCQPDGCNWYRTENKLTRKTWTQYHDADGNGYHGEAVEEQLQLTATVTGLWTLIHHRPDGTISIEAHQVTRERAYELVETQIADLDGVRERNRTGRAAP